MIKLEVTMTDDAPPPGFSQPIIATALVDSEAMTAIVNAGVVDRAMLQSYLMLAVAPLADDYEIQSSAPPEPAPPPPPEPPTPPVPPLPTSAVNYSYLKPNAGPPDVGQIIHGNNTLKTLSISQLDADGIEQTALLQLVIPGDTIRIDTQVWTVDASALNAGYYDFLVTPDVQAAVTGLVSVTFARPA
jgi:hypothetical protein